MANVDSRTSKPRSRTFTGCLACRSRKVKCDLGRPNCANCQRLSLKCPGYGAVLAWMPPWSPYRDDRPGKSVATERQCHRIPRAVPLTGSILSLYAARKLCFKLFVGSDEDKLTYFQSLRDRWSREGSCSILPVLLPALISTLYSITLSKRLFKKAKN